GRVWRVVYREAEPYRKIELSRDDPDGLIKALGHENGFWRLTAQRLLVENGNMDVLSDLYRIVRDRKVDADGQAHAATHALWAIDGLKVIQSGNEAFNVVSDALKHPAPGVRKAAIQILSSIQWTEKAILDSNILDDPDPNTRLAAILSLTKAAPSVALGEKLLAISNEDSVRLDNWLAKAVYIAAAKHRNGFAAAFMKSHPDFNPTTKETKRELPTFDDGKWKTMALPQSIERAGLNLVCRLLLEKKNQTPSSA